MTNVYEFPQGTFIGPSTSKIIFIQLTGNKISRFNDPGETISLFKSGQTASIDTVSYGGVGKVCLPTSEQGSIGRVANVQDFAPTNVWERFSLASKNLTNNNGVLDPCPTPTLTPTNTPTATSAPTATATPTSSPTATLTKTPTPTAKVAAKLTIEPVGSSGEEVLGLRNELFASPTPTQLVAGESERKFPYLGIIFIGAGVICIGTSVFVLYKKSKTEYDVKDEEI